MGKLTRKEYEHMLDHTPDLTLPGEPLELPPLAGNPHKDRFNGPVKPIRGRY